mmetsp:Transcript_38897/g.37226  ORF Transcript_38897/g.37226 Transcript_38897/m.37226 type:complete len:269 (+) Transcript_38897:562-1368(+)
MVEGSPLVVVEGVDDVDVGVVANALVFNLAEEVPVQRLRRELHLAFVVGLDELEFGEVVVFLVAVELLEHQVEVVGGHPFIVHEPSPLILLQLLLQDQPILSEHIVMEEDVVEGLALAVGDLEHAFEGNLAFAVGAAALSQVEHFLPLHKVKAHHHVIVVSEDQLVVGDEVGFGVGADAEVLFDDLVEAHDPLDPLGLLERDLHEGFCVLEVLPLLAFEEVVVDLLAVVLIEAQVDLEVGGVVRNLHVRLALVHMAQAPILHIVSRHL